MDAILATLDQRSADGSWMSMLDWLEDQLSNSDVARDDELADWLMQNGVTERQARRALRYRPWYDLFGFDRRFTPVRVGLRHAMCYDPTCRGFVPIRSSALWASLHESLFD